MKVMQSVRKDFENMLDRIELLRKFSQMNSN